MRHPIPTELHQLTDDERPVGNVRQWVTYNPLTATYDTPDGTSAAAELVDNVQCLADVLYIAHIRAKQRDGKDA